ncbi:MAG: carbohydrate kinase [Bacteroidales bacterium]|nr:carbohydrate kinase [Candidatus Physcousia equi]
MRKIIGMGETVLDILFRNNQPFAAVPGGSCFNSIISLGRTHTPCLFMGSSGNDRVGQQTLDFLRENGVDTTFFALRDGEKSALSLAFLDENGDAHYQFYKDTPRFDHSAPLPEFGPDDVLLFGSYFAASASTRPLVCRVLEAAQRSGCIIYYDLNFRRSHEHELDVLMPTLVQNFRASNLVRGSADDFEVMYRERDARTIYRRHIAAHCPLFICTSGAGLITVCTPEGAMDFDVPRVPTVSTVGAGDNFNAGFAYALLRDGITHDELAHLTLEQWTRLVRTGCAFAAAVCQSEQNSVGKDFTVL